MFNGSLVLVAIDHATVVERTLGVAASIAKGRGAEVHALHVISHSRGRAMYRNDQGGHDEAHISSRLVAIQHSAERDAVRVRTVALRGKPEYVIPAYGQLHDATVLVLERDYGSSPLWRNGRMVRELVRRSAMPLLVLPPSARTVEANHGVRLNRILAPIDFSIASAVAVKTAVGLARHHGSHLTLLHAMEDVPGHLVFSGSEAWRLMQRVPAQTRAMTDRLRRNAATLGATEVEVRVATGDADRAILDVTTQGDADLIVMGAAPRSWLNRTALGSTLDRVLRRSKVPVLIVPVLAGAHEWSTHLRAA